MTTLQTPATSRRRTTISRHPPHPDRNVNVGASERLVTGTLGALLFLPLVRRPSLGASLLAAAGAALVARAATGSCPAYKALGIDTAHQGRASAEDFYEKGIHVDQAYIIMKSPEELYAFWRDFANLPRFMRHLESVRVESSTRSHWTAQGPMGSVEWDAEIINEEPNRLIAWRSVEGADVDNAGSVTFTPLGHDRGTEVRVVIDYIPPAGQVGSWVAALFGQEPSQQVQEDLRRFKRLLESGEIPTTAGQPRGTCG